MMSSSPWRSSVPGATREIAARRLPSRGGSFSYGVRMKPKSAFDLSGLSSRVLSGIQPRLDRLAHRLGLDGANCASRFRAGWHERELEAELSTLLEAAGLLCRRTEAARKADLSECPGLRTNRGSPRRGRDRKSDGE